MPDKIHKIRGNDPRLNQPTKPRKGYRSIHRPSGLWQWKTNGYDVIIYDPVRRPTRIHVWDLENKTRDEWWDNRGWDEFGHSIYPSEVRDYIANHLEKRV
jgi:hypothetical protein